jgi:hypothetical protein
MIGTCWKCDGVHNRVLVHIIADKPIETMRQILVVVRDKFVTQSLIPER